MVSRPQRGQRGRVRDGGFARTLNAIQFGLQPCWHLCVTCKGEGGYGTGTEYRKPAVRRCRTPVAIAVQPKNQIGRWGVERARPAASARPAPAKLFHAMQRRSSAPAPASSEAAPPVPRSAAGARRRCRCCREGGLLGRRAARRLFEAHVRMRGCGVHIHALLLPVGQAPVRQEGE